MEPADVRDLSLRELTVRLGGQLSELVREELALARAELFANARQAILGGGMFATAAVLGLSGWLAMIAAAIVGLAYAVPLWASALIVGGALLLVAGALGMLGRARLARGTPPLSMTAANLRRDLAELTGRNTRR